MHPSFSSYLCFIKLMWCLDIAYDRRMSYMEFKRYELTIKRQSAEAN